MKPTIRRYDPGNEYFISEQCHINELANTPDDPDVSIARARVEPGITTRWHRVLDTSERYVILEGLGLVEVDTMTPQHVGPGDVVIIPPSGWQRITNIGPKDLIFLAICNPRFQHHAYEEIDKP
jgi:mannose-6-phosphate isomerase-like protein (cupin superfamily)